KLLLAGKQAQNKDNEYVNTFNITRDIHFDIIKELNPRESSSIVAHVTTQLNALKSLLDGIYLINELSPKTSDKLVSFGELLSSFIISETLKNRGLSTECKNSQELIITNSNFTKAEVNYKITNKNIQDYFAKASQKITVI